MGLHVDRMAGFAGVAAPHRWLPTAGGRKLFSRCRHILMFSSKACVPENTQSKLPKDDG
jgi:hypothetical protein